MIFATETKSANQFHAQKYRRIVTSALYVAVIFAMCVVFVCSRDMTVNLSMMPRLEKEVLAACMSPTILNADAKTTLCDAHSVLQKALHVSNNLLAIVGLLAVILASLFLWVGETRLWIRVVVFVAAVGTILYPLGAVV